MSAVIEDSSSRTPLIFVLSPGVVSCSHGCNCWVFHSVFFPIQDPTSSLLVLADNCGMAERFQTVSLGQGQAPRAKKMIENGVKEVKPIFLEIHVQ